MLEVLVGLIALLIGALFCFAGVYAMRVIFPFWGFFVGFVGGAGLVANITGEGFFGTVLGWFVGFAIGILFAVCAYLFYEVAIVLALASLGFTLASALMTAIGMDWNWLIALIGVAVGVVFAIGSIVFNAPFIVLVFITAVAGAAVMVEGLLLVFNIVNLNGFATQESMEIIRENWAWFLVWLLLAIGGVVTQLRTAANMATMRELWDQSALPPDVYDSLSKQ